MAKILRRPGQRFLTGAQYNDINSTILGDVVRWVEEDFGISTAEDVNNYILNHKDKIMKNYRALGLRGVELPNTWRNLIGRVGRDARRMKGIQNIIDRSYGSGVGRRSGLRG